MNYVKRFLDDESGITAIEYGLITALIGIGSYVAVQSIGVWITGPLNTVSTNLAAVR